MSTPAVFQPARIQDVMELDANQRQTKTTSRLRLMVEIIQLSNLAGKVGALIYQHGDEGVSALSCFGLYARIDNRHYHLRPRDHLLPTPGRLRFDQLKERSNPGEIKMPSYNTPGRQ